MTRQHLSLLIIILASLPVMSQNSFNTQWHFGQGNGVDFSLGTPQVVPSSGDTPSEVEPASVCNNQGQLMAYTDGLFLYNAAGDVVDNGEFESLSFESIFSPIAGEPMRYYLFRSSVALGVTWTIVDLAAMDDLGAIDEAEKDIQFAPHISQLMVTSQSNSNDYWLVTADNNSGVDNLLQLTSYVVTADTIQLSSNYEQDFVWAGFFSELDEARMSPQCDRIATSHKGHYMVMFNFDNETGVVSTGFNNSAFDPGGFFVLNYVAFSPEGQYLYVLRDEDEIARYDATVNTDFEFEASAEDLFGNLQYSHIKLGPDGLIYLLGENGQTLDAITDADSDEPSLIENVLELNGQGGELFPNTVNSCGLAVSILSENACEGDSIDISAFLSLEVDSLYWVIDGEMDPADTVPSVLSIEDLLLPVGSYDIDLFYLLDTVWFNVHNVSTVFAQPSVSLGPDQSICLGDSVLLIIDDDTGADISWSTGSSNDSLYISSSDQYSVSLINGLCVAEDEMILEVTPMPDSGLDQVVVCDSIYPIVLDATGVAIDSYEWGDGTTNPTLLVDSGGTYALTMSNSCFTLIDSIEVTYVVFPETLVEEEYTLCAGDTLTLESAFGLGDIEWSNGVIGPTATITGGGALVISIDYLGCTAQQQFFVDLIPEPQSGLNDIIVCDSIYPVTLDATGVAIDTYEWINGSVEPMLEVDSAGIYPITITNTCFSVNDSAQVIYVVFPDNLVASEYDVCADDTLVVQSAFPLGEIFWSNGDFGAQSFITDEGFFTVEVNYLGCSASDEFEVDRLEYIDATSLIVPNVVTINDDGQNEVFRPFLPLDPQRPICSVSTLEVDLEIYNRWGTLLEERSCAWFGRTEGGYEVEEGTYFYILDIRSQCLDRSSEKRDAGNFQVLK